ncbi:MAG TPA: hypothetical protein VFN09_06660 [Rhodanobacteraceae bacterium]|nr:hypothetical protein [Rhodanobacteraceae bacterium]
MAKKLAPAPAQTLDIVEKTPPAIAAVEAQARAAGEFATAEQVHGWIRMGMMAGQMRAATVSEAVSQRMIAESYRRAAESRDYVGMPCINADGVCGNVSTLEEFCQAFLGKTARRCRQIAENYDLIGAELFESAERIGFGQRDYNALKALPADDQAVVKTAIAEGGDHAAVVGILTDLVGRLAEEKAALKADILAKDERAGERERKIETLGKQVRQARDQRDRATPEEAVEAARRMAGAVAIQCKSDITAHGADIDSLRSRFAALRELAEAAGDATTHDTYMGGLLGELLTDIRVLRDELNLPIVNDHGDPAWLQGV